jgi:hypothetical protein
MARGLASIFFFFFFFSWSLLSSLPRSERKQRRQEAHRSPNLVRGGLQLEISRDFYLFIALGVWAGCEGQGGRGWYYFFRLPQPVVSFFPAASEEEEGATGLAGALACAFAWLEDTPERERERE